MEPNNDDWTWLEEIMGPVDDDFAAAVLEVPLGQDRAELGFFE